MDILEMERHTHKHNKMYPDATIKLASSASDQNVYFTYVCMVNNIKPSSYDKGHNQPSNNNLDGEAEEVEQEEVIKVERSKALHELVESHKKDYYYVTNKEFNEDNLSTPQPPTILETRDNEDDLESNNNPNILKLTKMKWLTEDQDESPDSSSPSISSVNSSTSTTCSRESEEELGKCISVNDKYLSTILRLDKEHNMFGLSNITIVGSQPSKKMRKDDDRPVFHQTAIVQVCCGNKCCKHMSKTDLPTSLKRTRCTSYCMDPCCMFSSPPCPSPCDPPCPLASCSNTCTACPGGKCRCKSLCPPIKCVVDCCNSFGMTIAVKRKPKYDPAPIELTPRSSCVLQKPLAARSCHHFPTCLPPSSCFPYLMPCFWPSRASAPCNTPAHCFHNPPCRPPRRPKPKLRPEEMCPPGGKCLDNKQHKCENINCLGNIPDFKKEIQTRFGPNQAPASAATK